jgi:tetratricopeptide (TPR) repeat protein
MSRQPVVNEIATLLTNANSMKDFPDAAMLYCRKALECISHSKFSEMFGAFPNLEQYPSFSKVMKEIDVDLNSQTKNTMWSVNAQTRSSLHWSKETEGGREGKFHHVLAVIQQIKAIFHDIFGSELQLKQSPDSQKSLATEIIDENITHSISTINSEGEYELDELENIEITIDAAQEAVENGVLFTSERELELGKLSVISGSYARAKSHLEQAKRGFENAENWEGMVKAMIELAVLYRTLGDDEDARNLVEQCCEISKSKNLESCLAASYKMFGNICRVDEQLKAEQFYNDAMQIYKKLNDENGIAEIYHNLGIILKDNGLLDKAENFNNRGYEVKKKNNNKKGQCASLNQFGQIEKKRGNVLAAISYYKKALNIEIEINYNNGKAVTHSNLANSYKYMGDFEAARFHLTEAIAIRQEIGLGFQAINGKRKMASYLMKEKKYNEAELILKELISFVDENMDGNAATELNSRLFTDLGRLYHKLERFKDAIHNFKMALQFDEEIGKERWQGIDLRNIGESYLKINEIDLARKSFEKSLELAKRKSDNFSIARSYGGLGEVEYEEGNVVGAKKYYQLCLKVCENLEKPKAIASTLISIAHCDITTDNFPEANNNLIRAIKLSQSHNYAKGEREATQMLAWNFHQIGDFSNAEPLLRIIVHLHKEADLELPKWFVENGYIDQDDVWDYPKQ